MASAKPTRTLSEVGPVERAIKRRRTPADMARIKAGLAALIREYRPLTKRQLFYLAVVRALVRKTQGDYKDVVCDLGVKLCREGAVDWDDIVDETRWVIKVETRTSLSAWVEESIGLYRRDIWEGKRERVQIWSESFSAAGLMTDVTRRWRVPLYPCRGYGSHKFLHDAAVDMERLTVENDIVTHVYIFGDYDPSGQDIIRHTKSLLRDYGPRAAVEFHQVAVTREQIEAWRLPTAPPKKTDSRTAKFGDDRTVELEAIPPDRFRRLVESCITQHFDRAELASMLRSESAQRETARDLIGSLGLYDKFDRVEGDPDPEPPDLGDKLIDTIVNTVFRGKATLTTQENREVLEALEAVRKTFQAFLPPAAN